MLQAVRREVLEEVGIEVSEVQIVGTQPWPIGRAGSCELMVGCVAKACNKQIALDVSELEDAKWCSREDVHRAVISYAPVSTAGNGGRTSGVMEQCQTSSLESVEYFIPPPFAIAHHLIKAWTQRDTAWFGSKL